MIQGLLSTVIYCRWCAMQWRPEVLIMGSYFSATFKCHFCLSCLCLSIIAQSQRIHKSMVPLPSALQSVPIHFSSKGFHICLSRTCKRANDQEAWRSLKGNVPCPSRIRESAWGVFHAHGKDPTVARLKGLKEGSCCWTLIPHIFYRFKQTWKDSAGDWQGVLLRLGHFQNRPPTKCCISTISLSLVVVLPPFDTSNISSPNLKKLNWDSELVSKWTIHKWYCNDNAAKKLKKCECIYKL